VVLVIHPSTEAPDYEGYERRLGGRSFEAEGFEVLGDFKKEE